MLPIKAIDKVSFVQYLAVSMCCWSFKQTLKWSGFLCAYDVPTGRVWRHLETGCQTDNHTSLPGNTRALE